jgi:hypothetical protein
MRHLLPLALTLIACGPKPLVVTWAHSGGTMTERIELTSSGAGHYTSTINGVADKTEDVILSKDQINELDELFRSKGVCQLAHDPSYTPVPDEGQTTLELAFPDQHCKVVLPTSEWQNGRAKDVAETMQSMRPLRPPPGPPPSRLQSGRTH